MTRFLPILIFAALLSAAATPAFAQGGAYVNPYVGVLMISDSELDEEDFGVTIDPSLTVGGRIGTMIRENWMIEAAAGWSPVSVDFEDGAVSAEGDGTATLFYGALGYVFPTSGAAKFFLSAGGGIIRFDLDEVEGEDAEVDASSDPIATLGAGVIWAINDRFDLRLDVKDHLAFCSAIDEDETEAELTLCPADDKVLSHFELSGGLSFGLGG